jgi:hypothetical protein
MPFSPKYLEQFESVAIDNVLMVIQRDFKAALDAFYPSDNLADFAQRTVGNIFQLALPAFAVEPSTGGADESEQYEQSPLKLNLYLAVEDADPTNAVRAAVKYTRTARSVLKTCPLSDFTTGLSPNNVFGIIRELTWQYGQPAKKTNQDAISANGWIVPVQLQLLLKYSER